MEGHGCSQKQTKKKCHTHSLLLFSKKNCGFLLVVQASLQSLALVHNRQAGCSQFCLFWGICLEVKAWFPMPQQATSHQDCTWALHLPSQSDFNPLQEMDGAATDSPVASINPRLAVQKSGFSSVVAILARRLFSQNEMQNLRLGFSQSQSQLALFGQGEKSLNYYIIFENSQFSKNKCTNWPNN